ncbi:2333_t:CDS:1, partial [Rhizophagus irregularis]
IISTTVLILLSSFPDAGCRKRENACVNTAIEKKASPSNVLFAAATALFPQSDYIMFKKRF